MEDETILGTLEQNLRSAFKKRTDSLMPNSLLLFDNGLKGNSSQFAAVEREDYLGILEGAACNVCFFSGTYRA